MHRTSVKERKEAELDAMITEERIKPDLAKTFMDNAPAAVPTPRSAFR